MKGSKILSVLFGLLFIPLLVGTVYLALTCRNAEPILLGSMEKADMRTELLMDALCTQDYAAAEELLSGGVTLTPVSEPANALSKSIWEAYGRTLSYEFHGSSYATNYGVYRDVTVTLLDIPSVMADIQSHSAVLLANKAAANPADAYGADGTYKEEFVMSALAEEAALLMDSDAYLITRDLTLQLSGEGRHWMIRPDRSLMTLFAGGMGGA